MSGCALSVAPEQRLPRTRRLAALPVQLALVCCFFLLLLPFVSTPASALQEPPAAQRNATWPARSKPCVVVFDDTVILAGGFGGGSTYFNDVYHFRPSDAADAGWSSNVATGSRWSPRQAHACLSFGGAIWLMAGMDASGTKLNDIWSSTDKGVTWTAGEVPPWSPRNYPTLASANGFLWMVAGGADSSSGQVELWRSDTPATAASWSQITGMVNTPSERVRPAFGVVGGRLTMAGGYGNEILNDAYSFNTLTNTWTALASYPGARNLFGGVALHGGKLVIAGGQTGSMLLNGTESEGPADGVVLFDGTTWERQSSDVFPVSWPGVVSYRGSLLLMGGDAGFSDVYNSVFVSDTGYLTPPTPPTPSSSTGEASTGAAGGDSGSTGSNTSASGGGGGGGGGGGSDSNSSTGAGDGNGGDDGASTGSGDGAGTDTGAGGGAASGGSSATGSSGASNPGDGGDGGAVTSSSGGSAGGGGSTGGGGGLDPGTITTGDGSGVEIGGNNGQGTGEVNNGGGGGGGGNGLEAAVDSSAGSGFPVWAIVVIVVAGVVGLLGCAYGAVGVSRWREREREKKEREAAAAAAASLAAAGGGSGGVPPHSFVGGGEESGWIAARARAAAEEAKKRQALERKAGKYQPSAPLAGGGAGSGDALGVAGVGGATAAAMEREPDLELGGGGAVQQQPAALPPQTTPAAEQLQPPPRQFHASASSSMPAVASAAAFASSAPSPGGDFVPDSPASELHVQSLNHGPDGDAGNELAPAVGSTGELAGAAPVPAAAAAGPVNADTQHALPANLLELPVQQQYNYTYDDGDGDALAAPGDFTYQ